MAEIVRDDQLPRGAGSAPKVEAIPAASVILLRDAPLEVLMILRHAKSSFVPDAWVFPGGATDDGDRADSTLNTMRNTAARELFEETGISLGDPPDYENLVWTSRWITPVGVPKRFDTYFFLATAGRNTTTKLQESEAVDSIWISPADAIRRHMAGDFPIVFPTLKNLEAVAGFATSAELMKSRRNVEILTTKPVLVVEGGVKKIILP
ncbi:MAG TPA: NUDIX hydrolase [Thermoanaerobaculia bacterium]|nr:NUDIX hydrolase [Thermoanaerobaculia bacterium]